MNPSGIATAFICALLVLSADASCAGADGTCSEGSPLPRSGGAMIQIGIAAKVAGVRGNPEELAMPLTTRVADLEGRVHELQEESAKGRGDLQTGLDALTETVKGAEGSLEHTNGRVGNAENTIATVENTIEEQNGELRTEIGILRSDYEKLGKTVGQRFSSMLQQHAGEDPAALAAPASGPMTGRVTQLEENVDKLEEESSTGRVDLKTQLDALTKTVEVIRAGGAASLENTISRVTSAEKQLSSLREAAEDQQNTAETDIDALKTQIEGLGKKVGTMLQIEGLGKKEASMFQTRSERQEPAVAENLGASPAAPAASATATGGSATATTRPLTSRIASLEKRVTSLEDASTSGRNNLKEGLATLVDTVDDLKAGGVTSLEHTTSRVAEAEAELDALGASATQRNTDLKAAVAAVRTTLESVTTLVGS